MHPDLRHLQNELAQSLRGLDSNQTQLRPPNRPDKWSIQQIAEHLLLTYTATETTINARLTRRRPTRAKPSLRQYVQQFAVMRVGYFPSGRNAPSFVTPSPTVIALSGQELTRALTEHLASLDHLSSEATNLFGSARCALHHVLGPLRINQWFRFQLVHGRHHIRQILAIRRAQNI